MKRLEALATAPCGCFRGWVLLTGHPDGIGTLTNWLNVGYNVRLTIDDEAFPERFCKEHKP